MAVRAVDTEGLHADSGSSVTPLPVDGDIEILGTLVLDRVAEIVELREQIEAHERTIAELSHDVEQWRGKAISEAATRRVEADAAFRHERELVTVLHSTMTELDLTRDELRWRRLHWWQRMGKTAPATPPALGAPAPR